MIVVVRTDRPQDKALVKRWNDNTEAVRLARGELFLVFSKTYVEACVYRHKHNISGSIVCDPLFTLDTGISIFENVNNSHSGAFRLALLIHLKRYISFLMRASS